ncbi:hypothetical protein WJX79_002046 [Trebouxia sp. C0005]
METTPAEAPDVAVQQLAALVPPLQLPHSGVTWSHQLDGDTLRKSSLALQPSSAKQAAFKARESVSMYVDDGNKTMQVVEALRQKVGSESGSRPSSVRMGIRGDRVGMATKAALEPSQLETHITSLMRASFGRLKKRYLAVGPDAVLTSSQKDSSVNRLHPSLPTSPRRTPRGPTGPKSPRKAPAATPRSTLTPGLELSQAVAVPTSGTNAGNALSDKASSSGWAALRHEASTGGLGGFTGHKAGWGFGAPPDEPQKSHKMDFTDVAFQMIGTAKKGTAWQPLAVTETYMGLDPQVFNSEVRRRALEWKSNQEADFRAKASATLKERVQAETHAYLTRMGILDTTNPVLKNLQERAHKHAMQRVLRADAFALEHKRVNDWDLSDAMANFADQYRQELREERIDQELKRLKAVQEVAQYRAEAQASRRLLEHQKSVAREHAAIHAALGLKPGEGGELGRTFTPEPTILQELQLVEERIAGKLERALGAANTPLLKPGVARPARPGSGGGRPSSGGRPNSPHSAMATMGRVSPAVGNAGLKEKTEIEDLPAYKLREGDPNAQPRIVYMHKCVELECWPATAVVSQLHLTHINLSYVIMDDKSCEALSRTFPVMQHLKQLCLSQTQLTDSNLDVMLKILKDLDLQVLDLSDNKLTSAACDTLSLALSKPQNPRGWALSGASHLGSRREGPGTPKRPAHTPGKGLNSCLQELNLSGNPIGDEGIAALEEVLCTTKAMTSLVLAHTELTEHSGPVLGRLVEFVPKLAHLDVSWNQLGPLTAEALAGGLAPGGHLVSLDVSWNGLEAGAGLIAAALQKGGGAPLRMLNLSGTRPSDEALLKIALMFQSSSKLQLTHVGLRGNTLGGVSGQCLLRNLHAYAAAAMPAVTVDAQQCSTGSLEPQLAEAPEAKGKKGKAKKGKGKKGEKEDKGKGKEKGKEKGKKEKDDGEGAEAPVIQAVGKHFSLDLSQEQHRAVACLLADHEVQAQGFGRSAWFNATLDGRLLVQGSKWLTPIDLQQWPKALPSRGTLELDVLQLPLSKDHVSDAVADGDAGSDTKTAQQASQQREDAEGGDIDEHLAAVGNYSSGVEGEQSMQGAASLAVPTENLLT